MGLLWVSSFPGFFSRATPRKESKSSWLKFHDYAVLSLHEYTLMYGLKKEKALACAGLPGCSFVPLKNLIVFMFIHYGYFFARGIFFTLMKGRKMCNKKISRDF